MSDLQIYLTLSIFALVVLAIAFDLIDMAVAALLGVGMLLALGILGSGSLIAAMRTAGGPLSLLFGGMVVARVLARTGLFERLGVMFLRATGGSGKRFLLLLILMVAPVCALLPNATTVILLAPVIVRVARALKVDIVAPLVLTAIVSNSAGMLTLVGDPATFLVGSSIGMSFVQYLQKVSLSGLLAVLVIIPLLPWLMPQIWRAQVDLPEPEPMPPIDKPWFVVMTLAVLALMIALFLFGELLPRPIVPPAVAIIAASLALLVIFSSHVEPVDELLRAIDWKTLLFLGAIFCLVEAFTATGLLQGLSIKLEEWFGTNLLVVALSLMVGIGLLSSLLANIPVVAASLIMTKGYLVAAEIVPEIALAATFSDWPGSTIPVFIAMMFGATLGGNATLIGASANIVAVGICASEGERVSFARFSRYGVPITLAQFLVSGLYVWLMFHPII
ncbi:citrate transporter [Pseudomonas sp. BN415]|uniref:SLC13 family permease n=1 Tax=Pseudomonas sp. BN415 TaxID=2567889 RepID=UPI002457AE2F|nr:SLC13 family permease [Pseudomonas sp. BN415]MDH4583257.1 citrate transporter [Pseudomonas sp. BN415]